MATSRVPTTTKRIKTIGRNLSLANVRPRSGQKGLWILDVKGDRGTLSLNVTEEELSMVLEPDGTDRISFTVTLPDGEKDALRRSFERQLRGGV